MVQLFGNAFGRLAGHLGDLFGQLTGLFRVPALLLGRPGKGMGEGDIAGAIVLCPLQAVAQQRIEAPLLRQAKAEDLVLCLFRGIPRLLHHPVQPVAFLAAEAPEGHVADVVEQGGNKHLLGRGVAALNGDRAGLYRGVNGAGQFGGQSITVGTLYEGVDQADRQAHVAHHVEAEHDDRTADGADALLTGIEVGGVGQLEHTGGHRGILQHDTGKLRSGRVVILGDTQHALYGVAENGHLLVADALGPLAQWRLFATVTQKMIPRKRPTG